MPQRSLTALLVCFLLVLRLAGDTYYVAPPPAGSDLHDGTSGWAQAYATISNAAQRAAAGSTILAATGTYVISSQIEITKPLFVRSWDAGGYHPEQTIVDGNYPNSTSRCFYITHTGAVVAGFTVRNGHTDDKSGAGVYVQNGIVSNCIITGNSNWFLGDTSTDGGGGIFMCGALGNWAQVHYCRIFNNGTSNSGGGIKIVYGTALVANCHIYGNIVSNPSDFSGSGGGGIHAYYAAGFPNYAVISNCIIVSNVSQRYGGGIAVGRRAKVHQCLIANNLVHGGAIDKGGGGAWLDASAEAYNCLIFGNKVPDGGGGGVMNGKLYNCTVCSNTGKYGGGVSLLGPMTLVNTIVAGNSTTYSGTNLWSITWAANLGYFTNCYLGETNFPQHAGTVNTFTDCLVGQTPGFVDGDYRLVEASPCVNAGLNEPWMSGATDLAGRTRKDRFSQRVDMGCYEYLPCGALYRLR